MMLACRLQSALRVTKAAYSATTNAGKSLVPKTRNIILKRHGGTSRFGYRCMPPDDPVMEMACDVTLTLVWAYLYWNFYHSGGVLFVRIPFLMILVGLSLYIELFII